MAKVFVDANYFIGLANRASDVDTEVLDEHQAFVSILSCHILFYINKVNVPDEKMNSFVGDFNHVAVSKNILERALAGPTSDLEDNLQLYSAIKAECELFLTKDKKLLKMKFFGKVKIVDELTEVE